ncbi:MULTISPECIES: hypothetical protein [Myroides]|uniref:hypothetical protein n=1 Tax=Myroides TaxID=76831 RepID=UPI0008F52449|nr:MULTISPECIES: hypothetical protein [Myroides]APA93039.1 hypothetical protein BK054_12585 [Myroides sp. ZB35]MCS7474249.1 hypothetical protein [Myroides odoratimimus]MDM1034708.1 hypothetical protein [Myroides odoratimimus]MDM1038506.1 hypothetical protein [Myroides odoratimimus]MDM1053026.1 hypothetical protein [Myroides odoratimimus]
MKTQHKENQNKNGSCVTLCNNNISTEIISNTISQEHKNFIDSRLEHYHNNPDDLMDFEELVNKFEKEL